LINSEDYRKDFGGGHDDIPECDSDLENEINRQIENERSEEFEMIREGIEFRGVRDPNTNVFLEDFPVKKAEVGIKESLWYEDSQQMAPTNQEKYEGNQPDYNLELESVYGYRCYDTRNNLFYTNEGLLVYHCASVGIVYDKKHNTQKFFSEHDDDVTC